MHHFVFAAHIGGCFERATVHLRLYIMYSVQSDAIGVFVVL